MDAARAVTAGDRTTAEHLAFMADSRLASIGDGDDPESLRDFIAGTANAIEHYLREQGVPIRADGHKSTSP